MSLTRYFITGAQGFVGRYLVSHILRSDERARIVGIGRSIPQNICFTHRVRRNTEVIAAPVPPAAQTCNERYRYFAVDLHDRTQLAAVLSAFKPDVVIHLAAGLRDDPPSTLFRTNVEGTIDLLEVIADSKCLVPKIILGSTGGVYGIAETVPIDERATCNPLDYYSISKLAAEQASRTLARKRDLPIICARMFNLLGPGQDERHVCGRFASQAAAIAAGLRPPVIEVQSLDTTRDFIDVRDAASALILLARCGPPGSTFNVASGREVAIRTILALTLEAAGLSNRVTIRQNPSRRTDIPCHFASIDRLRSLGFECLYTLKESISGVFDYYKTELSAFEA